jgi:hypothetical protein
MYIFYIQMIGQNIKIIIRKIKIIIFHFVKFNYLNACTDKTEVYGFKESY